LLREHGHVGYVNLNTIVNRDGIWPLEFTCRFGYPGFAVLEPIQRTPWGELFAAMLSRSRDRFLAVPGFSVCILVTTPPFPYSRKEIDEPVGLPVFLDRALGPNDRRHLHYGEVGMAGDRLVTSGLYGWTMVVTGTGASIEAARAAAYKRVARVSVPSMRYRLDIGERLIAGDYARLERLGLLD
jgi:phosphoribosylamine--glycine ligase